MSPVPSGENRATPDESSTAPRIQSKPEISVGVRAHVNVPLMHILECCDRIHHGSSGVTPEISEDLKRIHGAAQQLLLWLNAPEGETEQYRKNAGGVERKGIITSPWPKPEAKTGKGELLIADDNHQNRDILKLLLGQQGYNISTVPNGIRALEALESHEFDLMLLDILMPEMDGYEVLRRVKSGSRFKDLPIIMLSGLDQIENVIKCIELGAEDFVPKPFNPVLLRAKIDACLEKKRLRDQDRANFFRLRAEQEKSESLLLSILPKPVADRLKKGESTIVDAFADVTVLFADLVDFTRLSANLSPTELVKSLNEIFSEFDQLVDARKLEKIKTVGDSYMAVGGLPTERSDHAEAVVGLALDMQSAIAGINLRHGSSFQLRIGIASGPVIAGIIGRRKFIYDLWGDTVNSASRMETQGPAGGIQVTQSTFDKISGAFECRERGLVEIKGKGGMPTYLVVRRKS